MAGPEWMARRPVCVDAHHFLDDPLSQIELQNEINERKILNDFFDDLSSRIVRASSAAAVYAIDCQFAILESVRFDYGSFV